MSTGLRLLLIGLIAPALAHIIGIVVYAPMLWFTAIVGYPIMVVVTFLLLVPLHRLFVRMRSSALNQLPIVVAVGLLGGYIVHLCLLFPQGISASSLVSRLAIEYAALGLLAALCCWSLYNWGPVHVTTVRSNP